MNVTQILSVVIRLEVVILCSRHELESGIGALICIYLSFTFLVFYTELGQ